MTAAGAKLRALVVTTLLAFSLLAAPVSFAPTGVVAGANTAGNVGFSINDAGNQATVTVDDPDLNVAGNTAETHLVNVESETERPVGYATTSADTPEGSTQVYTIQSGWKVADRNNDDSITKADLTLFGASDESITGVAANDGAYDVTIADAGKSTDGNTESLRFTKLRSHGTGGDTSDGTAPTIRIPGPVGDRNGDGELDASDLDLRNAANDESISRVTRNADGTVDVTVADAGTTDDGSESPSGQEQLVYLSTESVELTETGTDTGTFTGSIAVGTAGGTGELYAESGDYVRAIYWGDGAEKTTTDALGDSSPPTADLQVFPSSVTKGQDAYLDATGSSDDLPRNIKRYEWDVGADGSYEYSSTTAFAQHTFSSVGSQAVALRVTDYAGKTSTTQLRVDVKAPANVESTSVEHTGNGTAPTSEGAVKVATESAAGMLRLHLYQGNSESNRDLSAVGVDESTELWVNITFSNYDPDAMMGGAAVDSWTTTTDGSDTTLHIKMHPIRMQRLSTVTTYSPGRWPSQNQQADVAITPGAHLATFDMPDGSQFEADMTGATLTSDAQVFSPPMYDPNTGELTYSVAAPHWNKDGQTVDSNTNTGFYEATIPSGMVTRMGIDDPGELSGTYTSGGSTEDLRNMEVEETSAGGLYINVTGIHYSSGDIKLQADTTDPTANAGSDRTVDEDTSTSFDGTGSSDNRQVRTYEWDWDDDGTYETTGATPSHTFASPGTDTVTLRVTDGADNTDTDTLTVTVEDVVEHSSSDDDDDELTPRPTPTPTPTATPTATPQPTATATPTPAATEAVGETPTPTDTATPAGTDAATGTDGASNGASASTDDAAAQGTAGAAGPGFGPVVTVVALLGAALLARRRR